MQAFTRLTVVRRVRLDFVLEVEGDRGQPRHNDRAIFNATNENGGYTVPFRQASRAQQRGWIGPAFKAESACQPKNGAQGRN